jgi:hypothetical protein
MVRRGSVAYRRSDEFTVLEGRYGPNPDRFEKRRRKRGARSRWSEWK